MGLVDLRDQVDVAELQRRDVEGNPEGLVEAPAPLCRLLRNHVDHAVAEWRNQPDLLDQLDELARADQSAGRVAPPQQRLGPHDRVVHQPHARLVVQFKLAGVDCLPQLRLQGQALLRAGADLVREELARALLALRVQQGAQGVVDQGIRGVAVFRVQADPHRRTQLQVGIAHVERARDSLLQPARNRQCRFAGRQVADDAEELVAVGPCHDEIRRVVLHRAGQVVLRIPHLAAEAVAHALEHGVADSLAQRACDPVEVIEPQREHGHVLVPLCAAVDGALQRLRGRFAVGQGGDGVVERQEADAILLRARFRHVLHGAADDDVAIDVVGRHYLALVAQHALRAAAGHDPVFQAEVRALGDGPLHRGFQRRQVIGMRHPAKQVPGQRLGIVDSHHLADYVGDGNGIALGRPLPVAE